MSNEAEKKVYIVALTERFETTVLATSRQQAIDAVEVYGGSEPVWTRVTARPTKRHPESAAIDATARE